MQLILSPTFAFQPLNFRRYDIDAEFLQQLRISLSDNTIPEYISTSAKIILNSSVKNIRSDGISPS